MSIAKMANNIDENKLMWTDDIADYLLVCPEPDKDLSYQDAVIFNRRTRMLEGFEEDDLFEEIKRRMFDAGVKVVRLEEVRHLFQPPA
ncbi:MAG: hypothetical protein U0930_08475 [Pirellulales bacterium]